MGFSFGNFNKICESAALIPCALLADENGSGIEPVCYARNVEINGTILFQPGEWYLRFTQTRSEGWCHLVTRPPFECLSTMDRERAMNRGQRRQFHTLHAHTIHVHHTDLYFSPFQCLFPFPAVLIAHIAAIVMTIIMIMHIRSKYTAVGRKEMVFFFYLYAVFELLGIFLDTAIIPFSSPVYPVSLRRRANERAKRARERMLHRQPD